MLLSCTRHNFLLVDVHPWYNHNKPSQLEYSLNSKFNFISKVEKWLMKATIQDERNVKFLFLVEDLIHQALALTKQKPTTK